jgi:hypothetical protein
MIVFPSVRVIGVGLCVNDDGKCGKSRTRLGKHELALNAHDKMSPELLLGREKLFETLHKLSVFDRAWALRSWLLALRSSLTKNVLERGYS